MASANEKPVYTTSTSYGVVAGAAAQALPTRVASTGPVTYATGGVTSAGGTALPVRVASTSTVGSASTVSYSVGAAGGGAYAIPGATAMRTVAYGGSNPPSPNQVTYTSGASVSSNPPSPTQITYTSMPVRSNPSNPPSPTLVQAPASGSVFQYPTGTTPVPTVTYAGAVAGSSPPSGVYSIPSTATLKTVTYGAGAAGSNPPSPQRVETTTIGGVYGAAAATVPAPALVPAAPVAPAAPALAPAPAPAPAPVSYRVVTPAEAEFVAPSSARRNAAEVVAPERAAGATGYKVYSGVGETTQQTTESDILIQELAQQAEPFNAVMPGEDIGSAVTCPVDGEAIVYEVPSGGATAGDLGLIAAGGAGGLAYGGGVEYAYTAAGGREAVSYDEALEASAGMGGTYEAVSAGAEGAAGGMSGEFVSTTTTSYGASGGFAAAGGAVAAAGAYGQGGAGRAAGAYGQGDAERAAGAYGLTPVEAVPGIRTVEPVQTYGLAGAGGGTSAYEALSAETKTGTAISQGAEVVAGAGAVVAVDAEKPAATQACWRFPLAIILSGLGAGVVAILCTLMIDHVQAASFGGEGSLGQRVTTCPIWRRMSCVIVGGFIGAFGWYFLRLYKVAFVQVETAVHAGKTMPFFVTCVNATFQIITVAMGGSYGREAAPRELTAMVATHIADFVRISPSQRVALVACGPGAGLAAVYSVPFSGVLYICEHILKWDISKEVVVCAVITCLIGTAVSSWTVTIGGLYPIPLYSYDWASIVLLVMSAVTGVVAGAGAHCLRRLLVLCHTSKPGGRFPQSWEEADVGKRVWLCGSEGEFKTTSMQAKVVSKNTWNNEKQQKVIRVAFENEDYRAMLRRKSGSDTEELTEEEWPKRSPKGKGDWTILIAMPAAFIYLAILSARFPFLLGNGRAMAATVLDADISKDKELFWFAHVLLLKALATAAALGSGAAGGTLSPSCALGAAMAGMVGWSWKRTLVATGWKIASIPVDQIGIIGAAAFLAATMKAPVSAVLALWEFSRQTVQKEDLYPIFHGDFSGLLKSKLCIGMLLPMSIAAAFSMLTIRFLHPEEKRRIQKQVTHFQPPQDLDVRDDLPDYSELYQLNTKDACLKCFHKGLLVNACLTALTVGVAMCPDNKVTGEIVAAISWRGLLIATVVGVFWFFVRKSREAAAPKPAYLVAEHSLQEPLVQDLSVFQTKYSLNWLLAVLCAALGADTPIIPWIFHVYKESRGGSLEFGAICTFLYIIMACACAAMIDVLNPHLGSIRLPAEKTAPAPGLRRKTIAKFVLLRILAVGLFFTIGRFCVPRNLAKYVQ